MGGRGLVIYQLAVSWPAPTSPAAAPHGRDARGSKRMWLPACAWSEHEALEGEGRL